MNPRSLALAIAFFSSVFGILPFLSYQLGIQLHLPIYSYTAMKIAGVLFFISGSALFCYCTFIFNRHGKGTPVPIEPPRRFVSAGPYSYVRNPIYISYSAILISEILFFGNTGILIYSFLAMTVFHLFLVLHEEKVLAARFGSSYIEYTKNVPRWIPAIPKRRKIR
jgi:protein-S-isoprenylcysteine O-methyltransferase Ste14